MRNKLILLLYIYEIIKVFGYNILTKINFAIFKVKWRLRNKHNFTTPIKVYPMELVIVGKHSYGPIDVYTYDSPTEKLLIGSYCSIAKDVRFILGGNHITNHILTYPINNMLISNKINDSFSKGEVIIEDDVWIGVGAIILSGVKLGQGCVVGAGAVVTKSFPPFSIIGGNPARLLKMRFEKDVVDQLLNIGLDFSCFDKKFIIDNKNLFNTKLDVDIINKINKKYK